MKTSNKIIIACLLFLFLALTGYDYLLKNEYASGKYKDPYKGYVALKFKDFDAVDLISSTKANVKFIQGPFSVRIDSISQEYVSIKQTGKKLEIKADFKRDNLYNQNSYLLVISCPILKLVKTSATYTSDKKQVTDSITWDGWQMRQVLIDGFKQDSLITSQDYGSTIVFANTHIGVLNATAGQSTGSGSRLIILKNNQFNQAKFDIRNKSQLLLSDASINKISYHLADSAKLVLTGNAQNLLKK